MARGGSDVQLTVVFDEHILALSWIACEEPRSFIVIGRKKLVSKIKIAFDQSHTRHHPALQIRSLFTNSRGWQKDWDSTAAGRSFSSQLSCQRRATVNNELC